MFTKSNDMGAVLSTPPLTPPRSCPSSPPLDSPTRRSSLLPTSACPSPTPSSTAAAPIAAPTGQRHGHAYPGTPNLFSEAFFVPTPRRSLSPEEEESRVGGGDQDRRVRRGSSYFPSRRSSLDDLRSHHLAQPVGLGLALGLGDKLNVLKREELLGGTAAHSHRSHKSTFLSHVLSRRARPVVAFCFALFTVLFFAGHHMSVWRSTQQRGYTLADLRKIHHAQYRQTMPAHNSHAHPPPANGAVGMASHAWTWGPGEELAAVIGFLTSEGAHSLHAMKPGDSVDPVVVLDFDPYHSANLKGEMDEMITHVWSNRVVVLLGANSRDPATKKLRSVLHDLVVLPAPVYIDTDSRADAEQVKSVLHRTLSMSDSERLPQVLIGGKVVDRSLFDFSGEQGPANKAHIKSLIKDAGGGFKASKKHKKFA